MRNKIFGKSRLPLVTLPDGKSYVVQEVQEQTNFDMDGTDTTFKIRDIETGDPETIVFHYFNANSFFFLLKESNLI